MVGTAQERLCPTYAPTPSLRAERSNPCLSKRIDGLLRSARNDGVRSSFNFQTADARPPSRGMICPSFAGNGLSLQKEGAGNAGCALHPRSRVQNCAKRRTRAYRFSGNTPAFPAQWLYGLWRALLGDEFVLSPSSAD